MFDTREYRDKLLFDFEFILVDFVFTQILALTAKNKTIGGFLVFKIFTAADIRVNEELWSNYFHLLEQAADLIRALYSHPSCSEDIIRGKKQIKMGHCAQKEVEFCRCIS